MKYDYFVRLLIFWKVCFIFFGWYIYSNFTKLGDTFDYLNGMYIYKNDFGSTAYIMSLLGMYINKIAFGTILANVPTLILSTIGILYPVKIVNELLGRVPRSLVIFSLMPSLSMWGSIYGKDSVGLFAMGVASGYIVKLLHYGSFKPKIIELLAFLLILYFKPQYMVVITFIVILAVSFFAFKSVASRCCILIISFFVALICLYVYWELLDALAVQMNIHFNAEANATRGIVFSSFTNMLFDFFPLGFVALVGPTFNEAIDNYIYLPYFVEGLFVLFVLVRLLLTPIVNCLKRHDYDINYVVLIFSLLLFFGFVFLHYPFGIFNPGAAIRYRTNFIFFVFVVLYYLNVVSIKYREASSIKSYVK